jgi:hypothetical protein
VISRESKAVFLSYASQDAEAARFARSFEFSVVQDNTCRSRGIDGQRVASLGMGLELGT